MELMWAFRHSNPKLSNLNFAVNSSRLTFGLPAASLNQHNRNNRNFPSGDENGGRYWTRTFKPVILVFFFRDRNSCKVKITGRRVNQFKPWSFALHYSYYICNQRLPLDDTLIPRTCYRFQFISNVPMRSVAVRKQMDVLFCVKLC